MASCLATVGQAGQAGRYSVCLVIVGLMMTSQGAIVIVMFSSTSTYEYVLIGVGGAILLLGASLCVFAYVKGSKQSINQPPFVLQVN